MILGPDHYLWFTENSATIGRMNPNPPHEITEFEALAGGGGLQLTIVADGNIWFAARVVPHDGPAASQLGAMQDQT